MLLGSEATGFRFSLSIQQPTSSQNLNPQTPSSFYALSFASESLSYTQSEILKHETIYIYTHTPIFIYIHTYIHTSVYMYIHIHIHIHIYILRTAIPRTTFSRPPPADWSETKNHAEPAPLTLGSRPLRVTIRDL